MLAERTTLSMLPTITWEQGTSCRQSTVPSMPGNCSARRSRSASFVRDSTAEAELFSRGGYQRCCWRPLHAWLRSRRSELLTPLHICVRRPTTGVDAFARMGQAGSKRALTARERSTSPRDGARELSFQETSVSSLRVHMDDFSRASWCFWLILVHMTCSLRVLEVIMFFGQDRLRAKEGVTCIRESNHHRGSPVAFARTGCS